ncbi:MAG: hypothetical protein VX974_05780 [Pseudomonadota bacterium]|nr:hypothetical protein [Pseudomonadota bacterium]
MKTKGDAADPKRLVAEAYRIEGITEAECRSIFLDWALSLEGLSTPEALAQLLAAYGGDETHPMTKVLTEGLSVPTTPRRRGGWRSRPRE